jgi:Holliday junction resolvase-like predicted endonuclease
MKWLFKWIFRLFLLAVVLLVVFLLSLDTILRVIAERSIRQQTGMQVEIGKFHFGLLESVVTIKDLQLHNPPEFGGTPFLSIPEIHVEYDKPALNQGKLHCTLVRFNLGELDIVRNEAGQTNILALGLALPTKDSLAKSKDLNELKRRTNLKFAGIDVLNVSVGTLKFIDLKDPQNNREQKVGIDNQVLKDVKQPADLAGLALLIALRSGDFFGSLVTPANLK